MPLESAFGAFFNVILEALFPVHPAEREVLAMSRTAAWKSLPRAGHPHIGEACSIFSYKDERVSRLIWSIKYKKSRAGAAIAGYALYRMTRFFAGAVPKGMRVMVVPMPITKARRLERGFNQCELILDEMEKLDADRYLAFARDLIIRTRHTGRQTMKNRKERSESIKDAFAVNDKAASLPEMRRDPSRYFIVVIDDVVTTGSTMRDAVATLRRAGFPNTYGLSVAH